MHTQDQIAVAIAVGFGIVAFLVVSVLERIGAIG